eukprot:766932-Hanusia_phi.AAC.1
MVNVSHRVGCFPMMKFFTIRAKKLEDASLGIEEKLMSGGKHTAHCGCQPGSRQGAVVEQHETIRDRVNNTVVSCNFEVADPRDLKQVYEHPHHADITSNYSSATSELSRASTLDSFKTDTPRTFSLGNNYAEPSKNAPSLDFFDIEDTSIFLSQNLVGHNIQFQKTDQSRSQAKVTPRKLAKHCYTTFTKLEQVGVCVRIQLHQEQIAVVPKSGPTRTTQSKCPKVLNCRRVFNHPRQIRMM